MDGDLRIVLEIDEKEDGSTSLNEDRLFLKKLQKYNKICIQCHDNPDADALASGYALYKYFKSCGKQAEFIYTGHNHITKPNLIMMVKELDIPVKYVEELPECDILVTTDCQYGAGNVTKFEAKAVAMIDHHQCGIMQNENYYIRSSLGSCATVVWDLLNAAGFDTDTDIKLSTALYYGLYSDTSQFEEIYHPLDKDMRDSLNINESLLFRLMNTNLSLKELEIASIALTKQVYCGENKSSVIEASECDPNILGIISDFVIQVEEVDICVAFNPNPGGYKLSVRSCIKEVKANELAVYLCKDIGNGGGHLTKAGGFIAGNLFNEKYKDRIHSIKTSDEKRLENIRNQKEKEQLSDLNKYIGKFYRSGNDGSIGKIYKVDYSNSAKDYGILRSHCLWFDDEEFAIASDDDGLSLENIEIISEQKFVTTLNEWVKRIINFYGITL